MIEGKEIRIGNYLKDRGGKILCVDFIEYVENGYDTKFGQRMFVEGEEVHPMTEYSDYAEPIELSGDWLEKFGFEKALNGWWCPNEVISYEGGFVGFGTDRFTTIKYVHELQNYYFAVTGNELSVSVNVADDHYGKQTVLNALNQALSLANVAEQSEPHSCKYVRRVGESCTLNNNCKYPNCE